jgi:adenosylmethionine-8-amino-7-oxononanoate aminotransferase
MHRLAQLDHHYIWHPFTQMRDWLKREPIVIVEGDGALLRDVDGKEYLDANSSIWTNLHGHNHPKINRAIQRQLKRVAHTSALGLANEPASLLAAKLIEMANPPPDANARGPRITHHASRLTKAFFSDDGSTAMEVALKLAYEFARRTGKSRKPKFISLAGAYHGDTIGAVSLGHIDLFHSAYSGLLFRSDRVAAPYCYRCPHNRAKPERADAREYRKCNWECLDTVEQRFRAQKKRGNAYAGFVFEPLIQGAAGMIPQPEGWLRRVSEIARGNGALLIADEVLTAFGRATSFVPTDFAGPSQFERNGSPHTAESGRSFAKPGQPGPPKGGTPNGPAPTYPLAYSPTHPPLLASHYECVQPDLVALAKGLTGGYLPMAVTLTSQPIFDAFLGEYEQFRTFFHGHSYTGNQLGAAAALASLALLESPASVQTRARLQKTLSHELQDLWALPNVGDIRQVGSIVGIELVKDWRTRQPFALAEQAGIRVCQAMAKLGVLTRPIGNVIVLMPPFCTTVAQVRTMVAAAGEAIGRTFAGKALAGS